ncbi:MAG: chromosome segregation ATPase [Chlamydiales bacterium]|jgi:chromosome segregation ATPase
MRINGFVMSSFKKLLAVLFLVQTYGCVPPAGKGSSQESLVIREMRIELGDLRHRLDGLVLEGGLLEEKVASRLARTDSLKEELGEIQQLGSEDVGRKISEFESRMSIARDKQKGMVADIRQLLTHANDTTSSLDQQRKKISGFEADLEKREQRLEDKLSHLKTAVGSLIKLIEDNKGDLSSARIYTVKEGDSLDRIARKYKTSTDDLKKINRLDTDLIVIGQELKLP